MLFKPTILAALVAVASAQRKCGTPEPTAEFLEVHRQLRIQEEAANTTGIMKAMATIEVPVWFHVVAASQTLSNGYLTDAMLDAQLDVMNEDFGPYGISFTHAGTTRTVNRAWSDDENQLAMKRSLRKGDYKTLNLYFQRNLEDDALGYCYFPTNAAEGSTAFIRDGCSIQAQTVPGGSLAPFNLGRTVTHEVGHWFGLYHTFEGGCADGDEIADTPAQASFSSGCPTGRDSCPNQPGLDPIHNYMDYSDDACYEEFTPQQETRIYSLWDQYRA